MPGTDGPASVTPSELSNRIEISTGEGFLRTSKRDGSFLPRFKLVFTVVHCGIFEMVTMDE